MTLAPVRVAWIGTGLMGLPMALRLVRHSYDLSVHSRTKERAEPLLVEGAAWAETVADAAVDRAVVFTMLPSPDVVAHAFLGPSGLLGHCAPGTVLVDMSTSSPALARELEAVGRERGIEVLDAPVSGGPMGAESGSLSVMVGGAEPVFARVRPLLDVLGATVVRHGEAGAGQSAKLVNQLLIAGIMGGIAEAYAAVEALDLDPGLVFESVAGGAGGSLLLPWAWPKLTAGDTSPGFKIEHFVKDLRLVRDEVAGAGLELPVAELIRSLYERLAAEHGDWGTQALIEAIRPV